MAQNNKVKLVNPNSHMVGLKLMDGVREVVVNPKSFNFVDRDEVLVINSTSRIFSAKHLIIDDEELAAELGYVEKGIESLTDKEITEILKGNHLKIKKTLDGITEKHLIDRVITIAKGISDLATNKVKILSEWSGYDVNQLVSDEE